ncbi:PAS domain S-box protein [Motiliproteus sp. MSK22-1]|uniref:PAS domain S-box protein n=1 Tax=Motiliproteus sp. MSK22-1 TaxID=1897630 RepID=UPI000975B60E|nr:PAS domain S-box protein [Motiliproteus sp. MSK22-1]OMH38067.1 hypothetical protein BGP75_07230 [Motiliproteus sp. MSK22-1]
MTESDHFKKKTEVPALSSNGSFDFDLGFNLPVLQDICDAISQRLPCDISIMDRQGVIVACSLEGRLGVVHEGAKRIMSGELDGLDISPEMAVKSDVMIEGCNQPIELNGKRVANVGIAAPLAKAREYAAIVKICIEVMLKEHLYSRKNQQLLADKIDQTSKALEEESAEKRKVQESLARSEQRHKDITDYMFDSIWETGPDHRFTYVSEHMMERLGIGPVDIIGKTRWEYVEPLLVDRDEEAWRKHREDMENYRDFREFPYTVRALSGEARHIQASGKAMFGSDGTFLGYRGAARDATEQVTAEQALKESEIRFKDIAETASDWIWVTDENLRFTYISDRFYDITQLAKTDVIGKTRQEFAGQEVIARDPENWKQYEDAINARQRIKEFEYASVKADGSPMSIRISGNPYFKADGTFSGYQGTATDLTELKMVQDQLLRNEKLAALGGMVAGLTHEINTPVGNALTAASFLKVEASGIVKSVTRQKLTRDELDQFLRESQETSDILIANLRRATELIESFKNVAVDQSSDQTRQFSLEEYINAVVLSLQPALKKGKHRIIVDCPSYLEMNSKPGALCQVLTNLIMNSLIHGFAELDRGHGLIGIKVEEQEDQLLIDYSDNGIGISEQDQQRMFEPFFTTKRGEGSSGLGMHLVFGLITESLGGTIDCNSQPGDGVSFSIELPVVL